MSNKKVKYHEKKTETSIDVSVILQISFYTICDTNVYRRQSNLNKIHKLHKYTIYLATLCQQNCPIGCKIETCLPKK